MKDASRKQVTAKTSPRYLLTPQTYININIKIPTRNTKTIAQDTWILGTLVHFYHVCLVLTLPATNAPAVIMVVTLPPDVLVLICEELGHRQDFQTLFYCALASKSLVSSALSWLYRLAPFEPYLPEVSAERPQNS